VQRDEVEWPHNCQAVHKWLQDSSVSKGGRGQKWVEGQDGAPWLRFRALHQGEDGCACNDPLLLSQVTTAAAQGSSRVEREDRGWAQQLFFCVDFPPVSISALLLGTHSRG
jgi:hypothetical protein